MGLPAHWRPAGWTALVWTIANLVLGYLLAFPLLSAVVLSYYVRAHVWGTVPEPYDGLEAYMGGLIVVVGGAFIGTAAVLTNRMLRRRPVLRRWPAVVFWPAAATVLAMPFVSFYLGEPTVPQMLGRGLVW